MEEGTLQNMEGKTFQEFLEGYVPRDTADNPFIINETITVPSNEDEEASIGPQRQVQMRYRIFEGDRP